MAWLQPGHWTRQECGSKLGKVLGGARLVQVGVLLTAPGPRPRATDCSHCQALRHPQSHPVTTPCPERCSKAAKAREALQNRPSLPQTSSRPVLSHTKSGTAAHIWPQNVVLKGAGPEPASPLSSHTHRPSLSVPRGEEPSAGPAAETALRTGNRQRGLRAAWNQARHPCPQLPRALGKFSSPGLDLRSDWLPRRCLGLQAWAKLSGAGALEGGGALSLLPGFSWWQLSPPLS